MNTQEKVKLETGKSIPTWEQSVEGLRIDMEILDEDGDIIN